MGESSSLSDAASSMRSPRTALIVVIVVVSQVFALLWASSTVHDKEQIDIGLLLAAAKQNCAPKDEASNTTTTTTLSSSTSSPIHADGIDANTTCDELVEHYLRINHAFHQGDISIAPPLVNYGFYKGQGFGRLVDHFTSHCLLSFSLDRPCLLDISDRDEFYTWRSFINTGSYDWEIERQALRPLAQNVKTAIAALPRQEDGEWPEPVPHTDDLHLMTKLGSWPKHKAPPKQFWQLIEPWRPEHIPKTLLSPNWGSAWFPNLQAPDQFGACHHNELVTRIQNVLFEPTPLSFKLHEIQRHDVMGEPRRPYGAIHIRFVILQVEKWFKDDDTKLAAQLKDALQKAYKETNLTEWWLLSDKPARAMALINQISSDDDNIFHFFMNPLVQKEASFAEHSNNPRARGIFGHENMAVSILDWMILHESEAAITTHGSYGGTGARGRGKILRDGRRSLFQLHTR